MELIFVKKGLKVLLILLIAVGVFLFRKSMASARKFPLNKLIKRLKAGSVSPAQVAEELDIPYHKIGGVSQAGYSSLVEKIKEGVYLGNYRVMYSSLIDKDQLLILTELPFSDMGITGDSDDVQKNAYHNFVLKYDAAKSEVSVFSTLFKDTTDKFQKQEFLKVV